MIKIPEEIINRFNLPNTAFLSGSRAMGFPREGSDWDVCIPNHLIADIKDKCDNIKESEYFEGFITQFGEYKVNFIPLHPLDMVCWILATKTIADLNNTFEHTRVKEPAMRHGIFETFRGVFKTTIVYEGAEALHPIIEKLLADS
jgi:hypothetical protein